MLYDPNMKVNRLIFLHVPKTAGTAFRNQILKRYFQPEQVYIFRGYKAAIKDLVLGKEPFKVVTGHMGVGVHHVFKGAKYFSIVRDPVDRAISNYNYIPPPTNRFTHPEWKYIKDRTIVEYFSLPYKDNLITRMFSGRLISKPKVCTQDCYERALKNINKHFLFVGIQEEFEKSCGVFVSLYLDQKYDNPTLERQNVSQFGEERQRKLTPKEDISNSDMDKLRAAHYYDLKLYARLKNAFSKLS